MGITGVVSFAIRVVLHQNGDYSGHTRRRIIWNDVGGGHYAGVCFTLDKGAIRHAVMQGNLAAIPVRNDQQSYDTTILIQ